MAFLSITLYLVSNSFSSQRKWWWLFKPKLLFSTQYSELSILNRLCRIDYISSPSPIHLPFPAHLLGLQKYWVLQDRLGFPNHASHYEWPCVQVKVKEVFCCSSLTCPCHCSLIIPHNNRPDTQAQSKSQVNKPFLPFLSGKMLNSTESVCVTRPRSPSHQGRVLGIQHIQKKKLSSFQCLAHPREACCPTHKGWERGWKAKIDHPGLQN